MGRPFILHYEDDCIHCRSCKTRVGFIRDHLFTNIGDESFIFHTVHKVGLTNQDGGVNEQAAGANVQDGDADEQGGANEQNDEQ
uniref:Yippee domain-containing protein n=1 Tax=Solanum tuberosum TaxID=4113 RepID=M1CZ34_SOLTU